MAIQESGEMYLETILILSREKDLVRAVDVGEYMGYSKPSVSRAMSLLKSEGYILIREDGHILLTDSGTEVAEKIYERHQVLTDALCMLGVESTIAAADACKMEHVISNESFAAIQQTVEEHRKK